MSLRGTASRNRARLGPLFSAAAVAMACGGAGQQAEPAKAPTHEQHAATPRGEQRALDALASALRAAPKPEPITEALPPDVRRAVSEYLAGLPAETSAELVRKGGLGAKQHALLHVLAGGASPDAIEELGTHGRFVGDLWAMAQRAGWKDGKGLSPVVREINRRAAAAFLSDARARLADAKSVDVTLVDSIHRAAVILDLRTVIDLATELAVTLEPSGDRWLRVADSRAARLDAEGAKGAVAEARKSPKPPTNAAELGTAEQRIASIADAKRGLDGTRDPLVANAAARALLDLARTQDAKRVLAPFRERAASNVDLAATLARITVASLAEQRCPRSDAGNELAQLCLLVVMADPELTASAELLRSAWKSGQGRSAASAEVYVGLAHILPFVSKMADASALESEEALGKIEKGATDLEAALADAMTVAPELAGLHFYASALKLVFSKKDKTNLWSNPAERADFEARAMDVAKRHGQHRLGQAGVLFAAAMLALDGNSEALVDALPKDVHPSLRATRALIKLWPAVIDRRQEAAMAAISELTQALPPEKEDATRRAKLMLLMLEADFAFTEAPTALNELAQAGEKLMVPGWPPDLRLRALVDRAAALARMGNREAAIELLESIPEPEAAQAEDYARIAKAYALVLRARGAGAKEAKRLRGALAEVGGKDAPRAFTLWRDMWVKELDFGVALDRCGKDQGCIKRAAKARRFSEEEQDERAGRWLARIARQGILSNGTFQAGLGYSTTTGLTAAVDFSFALPAVEYPVN